MHLSQSDPRPPHELSLADVEPVTLTSLADSVQWVAWQTEPRNVEQANDKDALTKVPYAPNSARRASVTDRSTWGTRAEAERRLQALPKQHGPSGVGVMFGEHGDSATTLLGGIDLDSCRDEATGELAIWAQHIIDRLATYAEVSPSGSGVKLFFLYRAADLTALRAAGFKHGRSWKRGQGHHPPAIEMHLSRRFFAVTDQRLPTAPKALTIVGLEELSWILHDAGPALKRGHHETDQGASHVSAALQSEAVHLPLLDELAKRSPDLQRLLSTSFSEVNDRSRSGIAFALGRALRQAGASFEEMCELLSAYPLTFSWVASKGVDDDRRQLQRIWERGGLGHGVGQLDALGKPRPLLPNYVSAEPYPIDSLGLLLAPVAQAIEDATQAPSAICAQSALGAAALAVQPFADVQLPTRQVRPVSLYLMTIAESGERKSSADEWAMLGVRDRERALAHGYEDALRKHRNTHDKWTKARRDALEKKQDELRTKALEDLGPEPRAPIQPMIIVNEPTWEGLVKMLPVAEPSLGLFSSE